VAKQHGMFTLVYGADTIYTQEDNEWTQIDVKLNGLKMEVVEDYEKFLEKGHPKILIPGDPEKIQEVQKELKAILKDTAEIFTSKPYFLEILPKNCGKGVALIWLANHLGIPQENTMCFGDSMNDENMFIHANHSVAMINGLDHIKNMAKYITAYTNDQDGVAHFIEDWIL
jgi:Cof subfamily protein (haloacid dehalogenase superfamily)